MTKSLVEFLGLGRAMSRRMMLGCVSLVRCVRLGCVPKVGLEPTRSCDQQILSLSRMPIPPLRLFFAKIFSVYYNTGTEG